MKYALYIPLILMLTFLFSCDQRSEYERLVQNELDKGVRYDSLFLGYELGMHRQQFLDHSWELNQQHIITGGVQVEYKLEDLPSRATMKFYPDFKNDRIYRMPVEISYDSWAIWNRELHSDSLIVALVDLYEEIYGPGFIHTTHPEFGKESWIKVDGNRRISIFRKDDRTARIEFLDLTAELN
jgi:hypothetical protein